MSSVSQLKLAQGYVEGKDAPTCSNCAHYTSHIEHHKTVFGQPYTEEKDRRCGIGKFAVKKTAVCRLWEGKQ